MKQVYTSQAFYKKKKPWSVPVYYQTVLKNLYPVHISWPIAFTFINSGLATYETFNKPRNECNDERLVLFQKAKEQFESESGFNPDPSKLFICIRQTLNCMFQTTEPLFGTVLLTDEI